jgi:hypothetical protein
MMINYLGKDLMMNGPYTARFSLHRPRFSRGGGGLTDEVMKCRILILEACVQFLGGIGRARTQAVKRQIPTAEVRVQSDEVHVGLVAGENVTVAGIQPLITSPILPVCHQLLSCAIYLASQHDITSLVVWGNISLARLRFVRE